MAAGSRMELSEESRKLRLIFVTERVWRKERECQVDLPLVVAIRGTSRYFQQALRMLIAILSNTFAGPVGSRLPCSQFCNVTVGLRRDKSARQSSFSRRSTEELKSLLGKARPDALLGSARIPRLVFSR